MNDTFTFGKHGRPLSTVERLVKELNTWQPKTLRNGLTRLGETAPDGATRMELIALLAVAIAKHAQESGERP